MLKWWIGGWLLCMALFMVVMWRAGQRRGVPAPIQSDHGGSHRHSRSGNQERSSNELERLS